MNPKSFTLLIGFPYIYPPSPPGFISDTHSPVTDALASIQLVKKYYGKPMMLNEAKKKLLQIRPSPSWVKRIGYNYEGVCLAGFAPNKCFCGAPTLWT